MKFIIKVLLVLFAVSCSTPDIPTQHKELILIDAGNSESYTFSDLRDLDMGWVELPNGNIEEGDKYQFWIEGDVVKILSRDKMKKADFLQDGFDTTGTEMKIGKDMTYVEGKITENGIIRIEY